MNFTASHQASAKRLHFGVRRWFAFATLLFVSIAPLTHAERNKLKPTDFEPLTSLPWKKKGATMEGALDAIFRETNQEMRYSVLGEYLRQLPAEKLEAAFDRCIDLEGTQSPDKLVALILEIWGERDPVRCWAKTKQLFHVVGIKEGWLTYDDWTTRPRITVQDLTAIRASRFWLEGWSLTSFPRGVERSSLPKAERTRIMKEFADDWFSAFGTWPAADYQTPYPGAIDRFNDARYIFEAPGESFGDNTPGSGVASDDLKFEVAMRRWLQAKPADAPKIVAITQTTVRPLRQGESQPAPPGPSLELLMVWAKADLPGMIRWAESLDYKDEASKPLTRKVRGFLISRVDAKTRERWMDAAKTEDANGGGFWDDWAGWDPKAALAAAVESGDADILESVAVSAAYGPFPNRLYNTSHYGMGVIRDFDVAGLPKSFNQVFNEWGIAIMEQWGDIDVGEAARYGFNFTTKFVPRENLIKLFSGDDRYASDSNMIDRTFCALRVWAVVKPQEMDKWIATIKDKEMRKALTWLRENPWGTGPEE